MGRNMPILASSASLLKLKEQWEKKLPRSIYIKACWPYIGNKKEVCTAIHLENLHLLFDYPR